MLHVNVFCVIVVTIVTRLHMMSTSVYMFVTSLHMMSTSLYMFVTSLHMMSTSVYMCVTSLHLLHTSVYMLPYPYMFVTSLHYCFCDWCGRHIPHVLCSHPNMESTCSSSENVEC